MSATSNAAEASVIAGLAKVVMPGLDPGIHLLREKSPCEGMECRVKPGNDSLTLGVRG
jgi:hypothetical protein